MERWSGRVAIVTGSSAGIGAAIARLLAEQGMRVVGVARRVERVQALAAELRGCKGELHPIRGDVTCEADVIRIVQWTRDHLGGVDVLVNNAGVGNRMKITETDAKAFNSVMNTNVLSILLFIREAFKDMKDRGVDDGHIFNINSTLGQRLVDVPGSYIYQSSKHAVTIITEALRRELRDFGTKIKVTSLSPGVVRTEIRLASGRLTAEENEQRYRNESHLDPKDIANGLLYALSTPPHVQVHELTIQPLGQME